jgi:hypothetical protein
MRGNWHIKLFSLYHKSYSTRGILSGNLNPVASTNPRIIFCTTCKGRAQHLEQTLPRNLKDNADYDNCKFVVVDYCDPGPMHEYMINIHRADIDNGRVVVYRYPGEHGFRMAHAKNLAHRAGILEGADILVNLDADGFTGPGFAQYIADQFNEHGKDILLQAMWNRWVEIDGAEQWLSQEPDGSYGPPVPKGSNGRMAVTVNAFLKAGGYNEKYDTWGPDDKDLNIRLRRLGYTPREIPRQHLHTILHNDKVRFKDYPHATGNKSYEFKIGVHDSDETIVNFGRVGMGTVYRNYGLEAIELRPIPTRIFGIGMHKTATTSLSRALKILGFDSAHWKDAHWAKAIWRQMNQGGKSLAVEKHYALSDLPITLLYKELDRAYPGSKFILTVRDEQRWLRSARNHWDAEKNPFRHQWDDDPFTHRVHQMLYGRRDFDATVFLERYRQHNTEVREYFRDRPRDLLVMDMDARAGWRELCGFLDREQPDAAYPFVFKTEEYSIAMKPSPVPGMRDWVSGMDERFRSIFGERPVVIPVLESEPGLAPAPAPAPALIEEPIDATGMTRVPFGWLIQLLRAIRGWLTRIYRILEQGEIKNDAG